jgi:hypothetical protein
MQVSMKGWLGRRQGAGPPAVRLPGGGVRVRRSALALWLRRLEQEDMQ